MSTVSGAVSFINIVTELTDGNSVTDRNSSVTPVTEDLSDGNSLSYSTNNTVTVSGKALSEMRILGVTTLPPDPFFIKVSHLMFTIES